MALIEVTDMKKTILTAAVLAMLSSTTYASVIDNPNDAAYIEQTTFADNAKAKAEAPTMQSLEKYFPAKISLVDKNADKSAVNLFKYLYAVGKADFIIYGHENDAHHKMFRPEGGTESDTKDVTGSLAGVIGFDSLSFTGDELRLNDIEVNTGVTAVERMAEITEKAANEGAILTLSMHMPNFDRIAKKFAVTGDVDFQGYSPHIMEGNVAHRILPGGNLNKFFNQYLDLVADYGLKMQEKNIPVIFRPLHEQNGFWFWWGVKTTSDKDFQKLWEYIVTYLRDKKGVHNFLYAYSPNGPFKTAEEYLMRYPGDEYVDILGIDSYDDSQTGEWYQNLETSLGVIEKLADERGKILAITEAGVRRGGSLAVSDNADKQWFSKVGEISRKYHASYFMTWSNFEKLEHNFFSPYMVSKTRGHEMINDFADFYNERGTLFADGIADYRSY